MKKVFIHRGVDYKKKFSHLKKRKPRKKKLMDDLKCEKIIEGISNLSKESFWKQEITGWIGSKERISFNQYKLINKEQ